jgi:DNA repair photolyase
MADLVELFRREAQGRPHTLLLVTKGGTKEARALLKMKPCANVAISFSVNNPDAAAKHEAGAALVKDRLTAARRLKRMGWRIRIRIDPMILGYDYGRITRQVKALRPERVTLGSIRAEHNLDRFVKTPLLQALERPSDLQSLARYPLKARLKMYRDSIRILGRRTCPIGLCEETYDVWHALGLNTAAKPCNCGG